jgi:hypothetical protein
MHGAIFETGGLTSLSLICALFQNLPLRLFLRPYCINVRFLAGKIERLGLSVNGSLRREWDLKEMLAKRDEEANASTVT